MQSTLCALTACIANSPAITDGVIMGGTTFVAVKSFSAILLAAPANGSFTQKSFAHYYCFCIADAVKTK